jgi:hypothetical protein
LFALVSLFSFWSASRFVSQVAGIYHVQMISDRGVSDFCQEIFRLSSPAALAGTMDLPISNGSEAFQLLRSAREPAFYDNVYTPGERLPGFKIERVTPRQINREFRPAQHASRSKNSWAAF